MTTATWEVGIDDDGLATMTTVIAPTPREAVVAWAHATGHPEVRLMDIPPMRDVNRDGSHYEGTTITGITFVAVPWASESVASR